jgi:hypothetical protein
MCKEIGVRLDIERWYEYVPKLLETGREGKATMLWYKQVQPTEPSVTTNRISQSVIPKKNLFGNRFCNFRRGKCDQEK